MNRSSIAANVLFFMVVGSTGNVMSADESTQSVDLQSGWQAGDISRVVAEFTVGGHLAFDESGTVTRVPMSVVAKLEYFERRLPAPVIDDASDRAPGSDFPPELRTLRYYTTAEATIKIAKSGTAPTLSDNNRLLITDLAGSEVRFANPTQPLRRDELDLVAIPASSIVVDRLLPEKQLQVGDTWNHDEKTMQSFLGLDAIAVCEVQSVLVGVENGYAKIKLAGAVQGAVDGVATEVEIKASYLYHISRRRVRRINVALQEKRDAGPIGAGVDVVSQLQLSIDPIRPSKTPLELANRVVATLPDSIEPLLAFEHVHKSTGMRFSHDRDWYVTSEQREHTILRHVSKGELLAQCQIAVLPQKSKTEPPTVEQFQKDVKFALGDRLGQLVSARQWETAAGMNCIRIVASGAIKEVPIEWRYYLLSDEEGRRVAVTITVEGSLVEPMGNAEREIVESLVLPPAVEAPTEQAKQRFPAGDESLWFRGKSAASKAVASQ